MFSTHWTWGILIHQLSKTLVWDKSDQNYIPLHSNKVMNRSYDDFMKEADPKVQPLMDSLRKFCFSLGSNVMEDIRMHRVVFCKSFAFRWFVDVEPQNESILLKIQKSRRETQTVELALDQDLDKTQELIREAYNTIH